MKEKYIQQVKRELIVSRKQKKEVLRDLNEAFASALDHGEAEQQVIERLGSPRELADGIHEQLGIDRAARRRRRTRISIALATVAAVTAFFMAFLTAALRLPENVIGQAETVTTMQVEGAAMDPVLLFSLLGIMAVAVVSILAVQYVRGKSAELRR